MEEISIDEEEELDELEVVELDCTELVCWFICTFDDWDCACDMGLTFWSMFKITIFSSFCLVASVALTDSIYWPGAALPTGTILKSFTATPSGNPATSRTTGALKLTNEKEYPLFPRLR